MCAPEYSFCPIPIPVEQLTRLCEQLHIDSKESALLEMARSLASGAARSGLALDAVSLRVTPDPLIGLWGRFDASQKGRLATQVQGMLQGWSRLRYVTYEQAERDCKALAHKLTTLYELPQLSHFHFVGIPRGGLIVLGILSYALPISPEQLSIPDSPDVPLIVVDDCMLTGARFAHFIAELDHQNIVAVHLYSHPKLRRAVKDHEPRVSACVSANDLIDCGPEVMGDGYEEWIKLWRARLGGERYWIGLPEHVCFRWSEPDRTVWNAYTKETEVAWRLLPLGRCLKDEYLYESLDVDIQVQIDSQGPLRPSANVMSGCLDDVTVVADMKHNLILALDDVSGAMWHAIVRYGNLDDAAIHLTQEYAVERHVLRRDLQKFAREMTNRGLLE